MTSLRGYRMLPAWLLNSHPVYMPHRSQKYQIQILQRTSNHTGEQTWCGLGATPAAPGRQPGAQRWQIGGLRGGRQAPVQQVGECSGVFWYLLPSIPATELACWTRHHRHGAVKSRPRPHGDAVRLSAAPLCVALQPVSQQAHGQGSDAPLSHCICFRIASFCFLLAST